MSKENCHLVQSQREDFYFCPPPIFIYIITYILKPAPCCKLGGKSLAMAAKDGGLQLVPWSEQTLVEVNGSPLQTHGQVLLQFMLQDKTFEAHGIMTSGLKVKVISGVDFWQKYSCVID